MSDDLSDDEGTSPAGDLPHPRGESAGLPGFVPPDQRSWVHPSELRAGSSGADIFSVDEVATIPSISLQTRRRTVGAMAIGMTIACGALAAITLVDAPPDRSVDATGGIEGAALLRGVVTTVVSSSAWIGLEGRGIKRQGASVLEVTAVATDGPAADVGLTPGDAVVSIDGHPVASMADVQKVLDGLNAGTTVEVVMWRSSRKSDVNVILTPPPPA